MALERACKIFSVLGSLGEGQVGSRGPGVNSLGPQFEGSEVIAQLPCGSQSWCDLAWGQGSGYPAGVTER